MRRLGFVVGVLVGVLVLGGLAQETPGPHGQLSDTRVTQPTAPAFVHPNDATSDVRDVRERLPVRQATPTSANTVPAPAGVDSNYAPVASTPSWVVSLLFGWLLTAGILFRFGGRPGPLLAQRRV